MLPEPPVLTVDIENYEICTLLYGENENPPDSYSIIVYDITGETIFLDSINATLNSSTCISIYNVTNEYPGECAPLLVSVSAVNMFGQVETTASIDYGNMTSTGDVCSCLNESGIRNHY